MKKIFERITMKGVAPVLAGVAGIVLSVSPAFADLMLTIGTPNAALSAYTGPYATADIHLVDSTHATVTFTSLTNGGNIYLMGDGGSVALNVNGAFSVASVTGTNSISGFTPGPYTQASGSEDGFGKFNLQEDSDDGFTNTATTITVSLTAISGNSWASESNVLTANANGSLAAVHAFVCAEPGCSTTSGALTTGYAADGGTSVSEPGTLMLLGSGLVGFGYLTVRRRRWAQS